MSVQLVRYDAARRALADARSVDEVKDIRDKAQAMAAYARQAQDTELVEWATEIKVRAERRAGELLREMAESGERDTPGGDRKSSSQTGRMKLGDLGVENYNQSSRWQKLAAIPESQFEQAVAAAKQIAGEVSTAMLLRLSAGARVHNSGDNEWYTPDSYISAARDVLGGIDLDPASTAEANAVVQAQRYFDAEHDGLTKRWQGTVWMNPPYASDLIGRFAEKLAGSYQAGTVTAAVTLTNNATETRWFQELAGIASATCLPQGRVRFWHPRKDGVAPLQGQALLYLGDERARFTASFASFGTVWVKP